MPSAAWNLSAGGWDLKGDSFFAAVWDTFLMLSMIDAEDKKTSVLFACFFEP
jgi:hypothetical protein